MAEEREPETPKGVFADRIIAGIITAEYLHTGITQVPSTNGLTPDDLNDPATTTFFRFVHPRWEDVHVHPVAEVALAKALRLAKADGHQLFSNPEFSLDAVAKLDKGMPNWLNSRTRTPYEQEAHDVIQRLIDQANGKTGSDPEETEPALPEFAPEGDLVVTTFFRFIHEDWEKVYHHKAVRRALNKAIEEAKAAQHQLFRSPEITLNTVAILDKGRPGWLEERIRPDYEENARWVIKLILNEEARKYGRKGLPDVEDVAESRQNVKLDGSWKHLPMLKNQAAPFTDADMNIDLLNDPRNQAYLDAVLPAWRDMPQPPSVRTYLAARIQQGKMEGHAAFTSELSEVDVMEDAAEDTGCFCHSESDPARANCPLRLNQES